MPVRKGASLRLTSGDAMLLEAAMRESSNIADRINAALEAMRAFCDELWSDQTFQALFKFIAKAAMDVTKRSTFAAAAMAQVSV